MKRYIRSDSVQEVNLSDLFNSIIRIVVVPDARDARYGSVYSASGYDYSGYSDEELLALSSLEVHEISDFETIERIFQLDRRKLSAEQQDLITSEYATKIIIDRHDVENILSDLKKCDRISCTESRKNDEFDEDFEIELGDKLDVIHRLTIEDFINLTKCYSHGYEGNRLIVFMPEVDLISRGSRFHVKLLVYVKIDLSSVTRNGGVVSLVSFHLPDPNKGDDYHPYMTGEHLSSDDSSKSNESGDTNEN